MKKKNRDRGRFRQRLHTAMGIACVLVLFAAALVFPMYYGRIYDKNTLNRISYADVSVSTYEASYDSFASKLYALAKAGGGEGQSLRAVRAKELDYGMSREELTRIVNEELQKLNENKVLDAQIKPKKKRMTLCERYTIYAVKETDGMKGINCWKLVYENKKRTITVYLDEEYHKIYFMKIAYRDIYDKASKQAAVYSGVNYYDAGQKGISYEKKAVKMGNYSSATEGVSPVLALDGLLMYYDLYFYKDVPCNWDFETGRVEFDNQYSIYIFKNYMEGEEGNPICYIGLPFEKMIQF